MQKIDIKTPFNVFLTLDSGTLGRRIAAYFIDFLVIIVYMYVISDVLNLVDFRGLSDGDTERVNWGLTSLISIPIIFYTVLLETITGGYTIGKKLLGIKVIKLDGFQPTFVDYFIRWIFRAVEIYSFVFLMVVTNSNWAATFITLSGLVAVIIIAINKKGQRLGDIIAGTAVINKKQIVDINITILKEISTTYQPVFPEVVKLSDNDMRIIKDTYNNARLAADIETIAKLRKKVEQVIGVESDLFDYQFFDTVIKDFNYYTNK